MAEPLTADQVEALRLTLVARLAMAFASQARRRHEARMISAALGRIAEGEFGWCGGRGEPIPLPRLGLDATIATCIDRAV